MSKKLFVRNLPFSMSEKDVEELFSSIGPVISVKLPLDRETGRKRGFGFVEMASIEDAQRALESLNNHYVNGRDIAVETSRDNRQAA